MKTKDNIVMFRHLVADAVKIYEKEMRNKLDDKARPTEFYKGDLLYMYDPLGSENKQFSNKYTGPYRVVSVKGDHLFRLKYLKSGKEIPYLVNIQKVKRAYGPWNLSIPSRIAKADKKTLSQKEVLDDEPKYLSHTTGDEAEDKGKASGEDTESWAITGQPCMTKVSTVKEPRHGPTLTGRGNKCAGSRGPSRSPNRRNGSLPNPSSTTASKRRKKKSSLQRATPSKLEKAAATGVTKDVKNQAKSLHQNKPTARDELSPISHEKKKESCDDNGRYHLRSIQRTFYGEKRESSESSES